MHRLTALVVLALALAGLNGCSTPSAPGASTPARPTLASEQRRLASLFEGTPVQFTMQSDGSLRVTVPLRHSFDPGRFAVKPALGAVLERIAASQRNEASRVIVAGPADPNSRNTRLSAERAAAARDYMVGRGLSAARVTLAPTIATGELVLVVADPSAH